MPPLWTAPDELVVENAVPPLHEYQLDTTELPPYHEHGYAQTGGDPGGGTDGGVGADGAPPGLLRLGWTQPAAQNLPVPPPFRYSSPFAAQK